VIEASAERHEGAVTVFVRGPARSQPGLDLLAADHGSPSWPAAGAAAAIGRVAILLMNARRVGDVAGHADQCTAQSGLHISVQWSNAVMAAIRCGAL
jgi:hypothetical protein